MNEAAPLIAGDANGVKHSPNYEDISGRRFNKLTVLNLHVIRQHQYRGKTAHVSMWKCQCDCGKLTIVSKANLTASGVKSCGCGRYFVGNCNPNYRHGGGVKKSTRPRAYGIWTGMRWRCESPTNHYWKDYGGRGIEVCDRWRDFANFLKDMGDAPDGMSIDRIDPNGNYEPGNCRWATDVEQARNRRNNFMVTHGDETLCLVEWCERLSLKYNLVIRRLKRGWSPERAFTQARRVANYWGERST